MRLCRTAELPPLAAPAMVSSIAIAGHRGVMAARQTAVLAPSEARLGRQREKYGTLSADLVTLSSQKLATRLFVQGGVAGRVADQPTLIAT